MSFNLIDKIHNTIHYVLQVCRKLSLYVYYFSLNNFILAYIFLGLKYLNEIYL